MTVPQFWVFLGWTTTREPIELLVTENNNQYHENGDEKISNCSTSKISSGWLSEWLANNNQTQSLFGLKQGDSGTILTGISRFFSCLVAELSMSGTVEVCYRVFEREYGNTNTGDNHQDVIKTTNDNRGVDGSGNVEWGVFLNLG